MNVFSLEKHLIAPPWSDELLSHFPEDIRTEAKNNGGPIGLGFHKDYGHFALGCGQGPFIIWVEKKGLNKMTITIPAVGEIWEHCKSGHLYEIVTLARLEDGQTIMVVYKDVNNCNLVWVRELDNFLKMSKDIDNNVFSRFIWHRSKENDD